MNAAIPSNRCRACGATSYQRLTHRGADGVMQYSGVCRCSGCGLVFSDLSNWRERRLRLRGPQRPAPQSDASPGERESQDGAPSCEPGQIGFRRDTVSG